MYTAKILEVKTDTYANGVEFFDVEVGIYKGNRKQDVKKLGFDIETPEKDIKKAVKKMIDLYNVEAEMAILDAKKQEKNKKVEKTINKLTGESIS